MSRSQAEATSARELERQAAEAQATAARARKAADAALAKELEERDERLARYDRDFVREAAERARANADRISKAERRFAEAMLATELGQTYVELRRLQRHGYDLATESMSARGRLGLDPGSSAAIPPDSSLLARMESVLEDEAARLAAEELEAMQQEREAAAERQPS